MTLKVGINGFGRIGRMALRSIIEQNRKDLEVVAINNKGNAETSSFLLANDTIHGKLKSKISHSEKAINIDGKKINMIQENEISKIDWKKYKVNIVLECTGKFNTKDKSSQHINSGAEKVIVSAPCKNVKNIIFGVTEKNLKSAEFLKIDWSNYKEDITGFVNEIHSITDDVLITSPNDFKRAYETISKLAS